MTHATMPATRADTPEPATGGAGDAHEHERRGQLWLLWSFIICPCHLPVTLAIVGALFGGTAFGAFVVNNALGTGVVLGLAYAVGLAIGFRHLRRAKAGMTCSTDGCERADAT